MKYDGLRHTINTKDRGLPVLFVIILETVHA